MRTTTAARVSIFGERRRRKKGDGWRKKSGKVCFGISSSAFLSIQAAATRRHTKKALSRFHNAISSPTSPCYNFSLLLFSVCCVLHGGKVFQPIARFSASASPTTFFFLPFSSSPLPRLAPVLGVHDDDAEAQVFFFFFFPPLSPLSLLSCAKNNDDSVENLKAKRERKKLLSRALESFIYEISAMSLCRCRLSEWADER